MPALNATVRGHQGLVVMMQFRKVRGPLCRTCGIAIFRDITTKTLWQGWWGILSFFCTPAIVIFNLVARARFGLMAPPASGWRPPLEPGKPVIRRAGALGVFAPFLIVGVLAIGAEHRENSTGASKCAHVNSAQGAAEATFTGCDSKADASSVVTHR
ncbi:hypothetical protein JHN59_16140 [Streptomyces sp. MBT49]|uniref:hypothetical protein n=1 Tax=Streptomyces sp. MBT49 TaxID=1488380 RepID=UPI00190995DB|nr:hypothetical protein [Streptomyces sp. MBT49]MBK3626347.1 hypothetical protein [Streptomyces sp. MBT49]